MKTDADEYISAGVFTFAAQPQASEFTETKPGTTSSPGSSWEVGHNAAQCRKEQLPQSVSDRVSSNFSSRMR